MDSAKWRKAAEAILPGRDLARHKRVDQAITDDGLVRLDRAAGQLAGENQGIYDIGSIAAPPTSVSASGNAETQLDDISEAMVGNAVTVLDTASVLLTADASGDFVELSADVVFAGTGAAETAARSDHTHVAPYLSASATLDFPSIAAHTCEYMEIAVPGAGGGMGVALGPPATWETNLSATGFVSATDVVTIRICNPTVGAINPASRIYGVRVFP